VTIKTLEARLAEIAQQEQEWIEQGYCVGTLTTDVAHWNSFGVFTGQDLDDYLDACVAREQQKSQFDDDDDWYSSKEALLEMAGERDAWERQQEQLAWEPPTAADIVANQFQAGWA
jgi:hypothetical protein